MADNQRKHERINLPVVVSFRPDYGVTEYSRGLMKNISLEGMALETKSFFFIIDEGIKINLRFPQSRTYVSLLGKVAWKKQLENRSIAGIKLKVTDHASQAEILEKISAMRDVPVNSFIVNKELQKQDKSDRGITSRSEEKRRRDCSIVQRTGFSKKYFNGKNGLYKFLHAFCDFFRKIKQHTARWTRSN